MLLRSGKTEKEEVEERFEEFKLNMIALKAELSETFDTDGGTSACSALYIHVTHWPNHNLSFSFFKDVKGPKSSMYDPPSVRYLGFHLGFRSTQTHDLLEGKSGWVEVSICLKYIQGSLAFSTLKSFQYAGYKDCGKTTVSTNNHKGGHRWSHPRKMMQVSTLRRWTAPFWGETDSPFLLRCCSGVQNCWYSIILILAGLVILIIYIFFLMTRKHEVDEDFPDCIDLTQYEWVHRMNFNEFD